ncbi:hypothetical protein Tco_1173856, partial [Tanacetum coccineum]
MEQMTTLRDLVGQAIQKKEEEKRIAEEQAAKDRYWKIPICYDDDEDDTIAITPSSVEDLVPIPSESEGIPDKMCDVPLFENTTPLNTLNEHSEIVVNSNDDNSSVMRYYYAFYVDNDHFKEKSSGSTTTHVDFSQYDSFIFNLSNDHFPPADRSDLYHEEFADELTHIMSLPNLECFKFKIEPDPGDLTSIDLGIRKNVSTTNVNVPLEDVSLNLLSRTRKLGHSTMELRSLI